MKEGWRYEKIGVVLKTSSGGTPLKREKSYYEKGKIPWLLSGEIKQGEIFNSKKFITKKGLENSSAKLFPVDSVLVAMYGATVGDVGILKIEATTNQAVCAILPSELFLPRFLYLFLKFKNTELISKAVGNAQPNISQTKIKEVLVPVISIDEQQQIVAILDKAFAKIDQAIANVEQNIQNAEDLFQSKLNQIFSQQGEGGVQSLPKGWEEKKLGEVCYVLNGYAFKSKEAIEKSSTQLLRMGNLYQNVLDLNRKPVFYPDSFGVDYKEYILKEGDLIMSLTGTVDKTDYGYTVKIPSTEVNLLLNQRIMKIEVNDFNVLNKDYLRNYLLSPDFLKHLYATASGTRQANLSSRKILELKIIFPSKIQEQLKIVENLKNIRNHSRLLQQHYSEKLKNLEDLKKSLLEKAFSGELVKRKNIII